MANLLDNRALQLQEPLTASGVASVNFFNGRLLAGGDLTREQQARREYDQRLGLAVGDGVAFGLEVERDPQRDKPAEPVLRVQAGLAVNRRGQTLRLLARTAVALTRRFDAAAGADCQCSFTPCEPVADGSYVAGAGVYILTIAPAQQATGRAPSNGLDPANVRCSTDATVEAPQFRLVEVARERYADLDVGSPKFRNRLAYRCFGADAMARRAADPWVVSKAGAGLVDQLRSLAGRAAVGDAEVPLALLYWTAAGLQFIDVWAVRREPVPAGRQAGAALAGSSGHGDRGIGRAMLMQFQAQLAELGAPVAVSPPVTAQSHFSFLPAAGLVPFTEDGGTPDLLQARFFKGMTRRSPAFVNGAALGDLIEQSLGYPPIDTTSGELIWIYRVRENRIAVDRPSAAPRPPAYFAFASGHLPYRAHARFDAAYWNHGNYALVP